MFKPRKNKNQQKVLKISDEQQQQTDRLPTKKVKVEIQKPKVITNSIITVKNKKEEQQTSKPTINYKSLDTFKQNAQEEGDIVFQEQQAKKRYLHNIEMTKLIKQGKISSNIYRGNNSYANYSLTPSQLNNAEEVYKFRNGPGPSRVNNNVKNTCRFDYNPSLCKDWHDAGYCVFGNSCLYLHDRSNYKTGWELEKQFEQNQRERWKRINNPDYKQKPKYLEEADKFKVNQICKKCQQKYKTPMSVDCGHIFCLKCANELNEKPGKCIICDKKLMGIMNNAQKQIKRQKQLYEDVVKKLQKQNQQQQAKRRKYKDSNSLDVFVD